MLDVIRRRVEAFDDRFVFGEFSEEFERAGCYLPPDKGLHAATISPCCWRRMRPASAPIWKPWRAIPITGRRSAFSNHDVTRTVTRFGRRLGQSDAGAVVRRCAAPCCSIRAKNWACPKSISSATSCAIRWAISITPYSKAATAAARPCPGTRPSPISVFPRARPGFHWARSMQLCLLPRRSAMPIPRSPSRGPRFPSASRMQALVHADLILRDAPAPLLAFQRGEILCVFNLGRQEEKWAAPGDVASLGFRDRGGVVVRADADAWSLKRLVWPSLTPPVPSLPLPKAAAHIGAVPCVRPRHRTLRSPEMGHWVLRRLTASRRRTP